MGRLIAAVRKNHNVARHSSLLPQTWVLADGNASTDYAATRVAAALGLAHHTKQALGSRLSVPLARALAGLGSLVGVRSAGELQFVGDALGSGLPRFAVAASKRALPGLLEIKRLSKARTTTVYIGLPDTRLAQFDVLVLSRLDQMVLRRLGPARANLDNAVSTLLPLSGAGPATPLPESTRTVVVCIGSGVEPTGFRLMSADVDCLAEGLAHFPRSRIRIVLSPGLHPRLRPMVESRLIHRVRQQQAERAGSITSGAVDMDVIDYAQPGQPALANVVASATQVVATADYVASVSLAAALQRPIYIAGEERTYGLLRDYYHLLETKNLVRRFYPKGSRYSYMLAPDIGGAVDVFSAVRDHEPWATHDAKKDLDDVAAFIRARYREKMS
ncbi:hypothetical protein LPJ61_003855 [Coemansia biformis]|uniref:Uncharacterized protein n=1 Tax=Coemansia biformis TaxID=1286918 RepID=A0A9W7YAF4_9FUNG|nr:hypothetical protein LPJ61_003855 [Coemansia biformis]